MQRLPTVPKKCLMGVTLTTHMAALRPQSVPGTIMGSEGGGISTPCMSSDDTSM